MNSKTQEEINIGIDTSQSQLDIYVRPIGDYFSVENSPEGARKAARKLRKYQATRVLIEATGRLEMHFVCAAHEVGLTIDQAVPLTGIYVYHAVPVSSIE